MDMGSLAAGISMVEELILSCSCVNYGAATAAGVVGTPCISPLSRNRLPPSTSDVPRRRSLGASKRQNVTVNSSGGSSYQAGAASCVRTSPDLESFQGPISSG
jgi:hypothetical protein